MATKQQVTLRFRDEYMRASKKDRGTHPRRDVLRVDDRQEHRETRLSEAGRGKPPAPAERPKRYS